MDKFRTEAVDQDKIAFIVGADCEEDVEDLAARVAQEYPSLKVIRQVVGPVIATHCGPGTLGIIFVSQ